MVAAIGFAILAVPFMRSRPTRGERNWDVVTFYSAAPTDYGRAARPHGDVRVDGRSKAIEGRPAAGARSLPRHQHARARVRRHAAAAAARRRSRRLARPHWLSTARSATAESSTTTSIATCCRFAACACPPDSARSWAAAWPCSRRTVPDDSSPSHARREDRRWSSLCSPLVVLIDLRPAPHLRRLPVAYSVDLLVGHHRHGARGISLRCALRLHLLLDVPLGADGQRLQRLFAEQLRDPAPVSRPTPFHRRKRSTRSGSGA